jgi:hypothetical protein
MPAVRILLSALLLASLAACVTTAAPSDTRAANGSCVVSRYAVSKDRPTPFTLGNKTFQVTSDRITWGPNGSLPLPGSWGLLELLETPKSISINLDGVLLAEVPQ